MPALHNSLALGVTEDAQPSPINVTLKLAGAGRSSRPPASRHTDSQTLTISKEARGKRRGGGARARLRACRRALHAHAPSQASYS